MATDGSEDPPARTIDEWHVTVIGDATLRGPQVAAIQEVLEAMLREFTDRAPSALVNIAAVAVEFGR